jgi:hypothetical protein
MVSVTNSKLHLYSLVHILFPHILIIQHMILLQPSYRISHFLFLYVPKGMLALCDHQNSEGNLTKQKLVPSTYTALRFLSLCYCSFPDYFRWYVCEQNLKNVLLETTHLSCFCKTDMGFEGDSDVLSFSSVFMTPDVSEIHIVSDRTIPGSIDPTFIPRSLRDFCSFVSTPIAQFHNDHSISWKDECGLQNNTAICTSP